MLKSNTLFEATTSLIEDHLKIGFFSSLFRSILMTFHQIHFYASQLYVSFIGMFRFVPDIDIPSSGTDTDSRSTLQK